MQYCPACVTLEIIYVTCDFAPLATRLSDWPLLHSTIKLLQSTNQVLTYICMLFLNGLHLLPVYLHSCFLRLEQVVKDPTTPLSIDLQDSTDGGLFRRQLSGQMLNPS